MTSFINEFQLNNVNICDELIKYHKDSDKKILGTVYKNGINAVDIKAKESTDVYLEPCELANRYCNELQNVLDEYVKQYEFSGKCAKFGLIDKINIQHYSIGQGFHQWHSERMHGNGKASSRHLVFMTYLNDINDGGETEFYYQKLKIKPVKGKTVIFPTDWTHTHRGITSTTHEKYIVTGWFNFLDV